jgi:hypothetical protein
MNKDLKATLITISIILGFTGFITLIVAYPIIILWVLVGIAGFCGINIAILLWDSVRTDLDKIDREKIDSPTVQIREERLKEMMENDQKLGLYDLDTKWPKNWGEDWEKLDDDFFGKMDEDDKPKPSIAPKNAKEMMVTKLDDFHKIDFDLDENDKIQIG